MVLRPHEPRSSPVEDVARQPFDLVDAAVRRVRAVVADLVPGLANRLHHRADPHVGLVLIRQPLDELDEEVRRVTCWPFRSCSDLGWPCSAASDENRPLGIQDVGAATTHGASALTQVFSADSDAAGEAATLRPTLKVRPEIQQLPRCCPEHHDWPTLAEHLLDEFPEVDITDVVRQVQAARDAVQDVGLQAQDALDTAELIARQQLLLLSGRLQDMARLDPERHERAEPTG
jgi:hypothetical protein